MLDLVRAKAQKWLEGNFDETTKQQVRNLLENNESELVESFYKDLEFGTGGLRGIMGVGTNRMNIYTIAMATQGLCNYLKKNFTHLSQIKAAIACDTRNNSALFAETTANVFSANGIKVYLFESYRPTPELSFAIRHLGCQTGVVVTASHNPKEYNGYKAYWDDGGQVTEPHDTNIIQEVQKIKGIDEVLMQPNPALIENIGKNIDEIYLSKVLALALSPKAIELNREMRIVYTPLHGTGGKLVPTLLQRLGLANVSLVNEQMIPDGNFSTVKSPNPENAEALQLAIKKAFEVNAELVFATDPDADRVGVAIRNDVGNYILLNGNQTGSILIYYLLHRWSELGKLTGKEYVVKTIVTTELIRDIAFKYNVEIFDVLTGFKYIAEIIKKNQGIKTFVGGGEESYGYLAGEFVRDKDAVMACGLIAEAAAWAKTQHKTLYELLMDIFVEFGMYKEKLLNITKEGKSGAEEIEKMMDDYRNDPPLIINDSQVILIRDYFTRKESNMLKGSQRDIALPQSNVLQFFLEDSSIITIRPSGTEPKIKFYFSVKTKLKDRKTLDATSKLLDERIEKIIASLKLK